MLLHCTPHPKNIKLVSEKSLDFENMTTFPYLPLKSSSVTGLFCENIFDSSRGATFHLVLSKDCGY